MPLAVTNKNKSTNASTIVAAAAAASKVENSNSSAISVAKRKQPPPSRSDQLYEHAQLIKAKRELRKKELAETEEKQIKSARVAHQQRTKLNKAKYLE